MDLQFEMDWDLPFRTAQTQNNNTQQVVPSKHVSPERQLIDSFDDVFNMIDIYDNLNCLPRERLVECDSMI